MELLKKLTAIKGASSDEGRIKQFLLDYINKNSANWKVKPQIIDNENFQETFILVFGKPTTAIYAHTDTVGFTVAPNRKLFKIGGPRREEGYELVGEDSKGEIKAELLVIDHENGSQSLEYVFEREIDRGTILTFKPNFVETEIAIQSPYLDNRLGVWCALKVAETLENGAIVFSTYEEHGGNTVSCSARYLYEKFNVRQALICDITWVTDAVKHGKGVAISMRDSMLPRRKYLNRLIELAKASGVTFQLEVESAGGSDGSVLQKSELLIDWCFIGAPEDNVHSPKETVYKHDIKCMVEMYTYLMKNV